MKASENETVTEIVSEMRRDAIAADAWCETHGEMASAASVLNEHADRIESAHRREKCEWAASVTKQKAINRDLVDEIESLRMDNGSLRALVGDLAVALSGALDIIGNVGEYIEADCGTMNSVEAYRETLAKAREVCGE